MLLQGCSRPWLTFDSTCMCRPRWQCNYWQHLQCIQVCFLGWCCATFGPWHLIGAGKHMLLGHSLCRASCITCCTHGGVCNHHWPAGMHMPLADVGVCHRRHSLALSSAVSNWALSTLQAHWLSLSACFAEWHLPCTQDPAHGPAYPTRPLQAQVWIHDGGEHALKQLRRPVHYTLTCSCILYPSGLLA